MTRWIWKRWIWAGVFGLSAIVGLAATKDGPSAPPKVGDVITLNFEKGAEKKVKILKTERQPDGSYMSEVKDMKTGEVFSVLDQTTKGPAAPKSSAGKAAPAAQSKSSFLPPDSKTAVKPAAPRKADPLLPPMSNTAVPAPIRDPKLTAPKPAATVAAPAPMPEPEPEKKPGLLSRIFGGKKSTTTPASLPSTTSQTSVKPSPSFAPPTTAFEPGPASMNPRQSRPSSGTATVGASPKLFPTPMNSTEPPRATTLTPPAPPKVNTPKPTEAVKPIAPPAPYGSGELTRPVGPTNAVPALVPPPAATAPTEPPRTVPPKPVTPPAPVIPVPVTPPSTPPVATPAPLPIPTAPATATPVPVPVPAVPSTPVVPAVPNGPSGLPTIPVPPGSMSAGRSAVMQAGYASPAALALAQDIQPHVTALRTAVAPSMRALSARALSGGRHASSETVKSILFMACTSDPSPFVRACCIDELVKLGYYDGLFMAHLHKATGDPSEEVRTAAKEALLKMSPQK